MAEGMRPLAFPVEGGRLPLPFELKAIPVFRQGFVYVTEIDAEAFSFNYKLFNLITQKLSLFAFRGGRARNNNGSKSSADFKKARVDETADDFMSCVGVDFELAAKGTDGREFVAGAE